MAGKTKKNDNGVWRRITWIVGMRSEEGRMVTVVGDINRKNSVVAIDKRDMKKKQEEGVQWKKGGNS